MCSLSNCNADLTNSQMGFRPPCKLHLITWNPPLQQKITHYTGNSPSSSILEGAMRIPPKFFPNPWTTHIGNTSWTAKVWATTDIKLKMTDHRQAIFCLLILIFSLAGWDDIAKIEDYWECTIPKYTPKLSSQFSCNTSSVSKLRTADTWTNLWERNWPTADLPNETGHLPPLCGNAGHNYGTIAKIQCERVNHNKMQTKCDGSNIKCGKLHTMAQTKRADWHSENIQQYRPAPLSQHHWGNWRLSYQIGQPRAALRVH